MKNALITNKENFEKLKAGFKKGGPKKIHVLADFDGTLTKPFVNGKKVPSLISILRDERYLTPDYPQKAAALYEKYHAIEIDPSISAKEKIKAMEEWWNLHFEILINSGLTKKDIEKAIKSVNLALREEAEEFFDLLKKHRIPLLILSSSGLGKESIELYLKNNNLFSDNIYIISNSFEWDEKGKAVKAAESIVHGMNKNEHTAKNFPEIFKKIKDRKNVILLGNSTFDVEMIAGFEYDNLLKIGFLDDDIENNLRSFKSNFDIILISNSSIKFANKLIREIIFL